eukprot:36235-Chlamydomonas_euryale.AAC.6
MDVPHDGDQSARRCVKAPALVVSVRTASAAGPYRNLLSTNTTPPQHTRHTSSAPDACQQQQQQSSWLAKCQSATGQLQVASRVTPKPGLHPKPKNVHRTCNQQACRVTTQHPASCHLSLGWACKYQDYTNGAEE